MDLSPQLLHTLVPVAIVLVLLVFRVRRMAAGQRLRLETLWVLPAILIAGGVYTVVANPPRDLTQAAILIAALVAGALLGWRQAKLLQIGVEPGSHRLNIKASPFALILTYGLIIARFTLRQVLESEASVWHVGLGLVLDGSVLFMAGLYAARSLELFVRARAVLRNARAEIF